MTQANNVAIESSQINSSGVLLTTGGGTGLSTVGTNGQVLTSNGTTLSWVTPSASTLTGTLGVANGGTGLTSLTAGYIPFGAGTSAFGNSSNLFWDNTNARLGIGTNNPTYTLQVAGNAYTNQTVISGNSVIITSTNLNSLKTAGNYIGYNLTNAPSASGSAWCTVEVFTNGSDQVFQRATPAQYQSNSVWNRMSTDGGTTWGSWIKESGTGGVLQVVQTVSNTQVGYTGTTFQTVSSLSTSITPSSTSSKILVMITSSWGLQDNSYAFMKLQRGGSDITAAKGSATGSQVAVSQELLLGLNGTTVQQHVYTSTYMYLDSPASSSSTTYSIVVNAQQVGSQTLYLNRGYSITGDANNAATISTMTLMEIAG